MGTDIASETDTDTDTDTDTLTDNITYTTLTDNLQKYKSVESVKL
jgi:hypothetical protein